MRQSLHHLAVTTNGQDLVEITAPIRQWVTAQRAGTGLLTIWCRHTSASLLVQENADPDVRADLLAFFRRLVPEGAHYLHQDEGADDMPAHIKSALTQTQLTIWLPMARRFWYVAGHLSVRTPCRAAPARTGAAPSVRLTLSTPAHLHACIHRNRTAAALRLACTAPSAGRRRGSDSDSDVSSADR